MSNEIDFIKRYGNSLGWNLQPRTVIVEGTTDVDLFKLATQIKKEKDGVDLFDGMTIIASGQGNEGGTFGVIRELSALRCYARTCLLPNGRPKYRFIGLLDNDHQGRMAIKTAKQFDTAIIEYRDVFRLHPVMPSSGNLDPKTLKKSFEKSNENYKGIDWEVEDLLSEDILSAFSQEYPDAVNRKSEINGMIHRKFTRDGKARLHQFIRKYAIYKDFENIMKTLKALRFYLALP